MEKNRIVEVSPFKCVLLVDDDETSLYLSELMIKKHKFAEHTHTINDGDRALSFIEKQCSKIITEDTLPCPDLVFLDINMPGLDGFAVLESIKKMPFLTNVLMKVFMLSSSNDKRDIEQAKRLGVDGFINKPLTAIKLSAILNAA